MHEFFCLDFLIFLAARACEVSSLHTSESPHGSRIHARFLNHTFNYGGSLVCDSFFSFLKFLPGKRTKNFISLLLTLYAPASDSRYDFIATRFVLFGKISSIFFGCFENVLAISQQSYQSLVVVGGEIIPVVHFLAFGP